MIVKEISVHASDFEGLTIRATQPDTRQAPRSRSSTSSFVWHAGLVSGNRTSTTTSSPARSSSPIPGSLTRCRRATSVSSRRASGSLTATRVMSPPGCACSTLPASTWTLRSSSSGCTMRAEGTSRLGPSRTSCTICRARALPGWAERPARQGQAIRDSKGMRECVHIKRTPASGSAMSTRREWRARFWVGLKASRLLRPATLAKASRATTGHLAVVPSRLSRTSATFKQRKKIEGRLPELDRRFKAATVPAAGCVVTARDCDPTAEWWYFRVPASHPDWPEQAKE